MDEEENDVSNLKVKNLVCYSLAGELARFFLWPAEALYFPPGIFPNKVVKNAVKSIVSQGRLVGPENSGQIERVNKPCHLTVHWACIWGIRIL